MKLLVIASFILASLIVGCGPKYVGGSHGSYGNADRESTTQVVTQRDPNGQLLFAIAWTAKGAGGSSASAHNLLTHIHGHPVHPSLDHRAVYALQADSSLYQIPLTEEQIASLFREMQDTGFHTSHSELWQRAVVPHLIRVEATNGS